MNSVHPYNGHLYSHSSTNRFDSIGGILRGGSCSFCSCRDVGKSSFRMIIPIGVTLLIPILQVRTFGLSTKSYTLACFTAALTIAGEAVFAVIQWKKPMPILNMGIFFLVIWVFWLGKSLQSPRSVFDADGFLSNVQRRPSRSPFLPRTADHSAATLTT